MQRRHWGVMELRSSNLITYQRYGSTVGKYARDCRHTDTADHTLAVVACSLQGDVGVFGTDKMPCGDIALVDVAMRANELGSVSTWHIKGC